MMWICSRHWGFYSSSFASSGARATGILEGTSPPPSSCSRGGMFADHLLPEVF